MLLNIIVFLLCSIFVSAAPSEDNEMWPRKFDAQRNFITEPDLTALQGKFGLVSEPDESRGESRMALQYILSFLNRRPAYTKPPAPAGGEDVCAEDGAGAGAGTGTGTSASSSPWNAGQGGYTAKSLLPAIISSMRDDELNRF